MFQFGLYRVLIIQLGVLLGFYKFHPLGCIWPFFHFFHFSGHFIILLILPLYFTFKMIYLAVFGVIVFSTTSHV